jgi:hypothetical protein
MNILKKRIVAPLQRLANRTLRKTVNKASLDAYNSMHPKTLGISADKTGRTRADLSAIQNAWKAKQQLKLEVEKSKSGKKGFLKKKINPAAVDRLRRINTSRLKREEQIRISLQKKLEAELKLKREAERTRPLTGIHPLLEGRRMNEMVSTVSLRGNVRVGRIVDANDKQIVLELEGKHTGIVLDRMKEIKPVKN